MKRFLTGLILFVIGLGVGSQYYTKPFNSLSGQDYGLALAAVAMIAIGALTMASLLFGNNPQSGS